MKRSIHHIVVHCSATREGKFFNAKDIDKWHRERGFREIGYHYVILLDGTIEVGRSENEQGAHVRGFNRSSIGIGYIGGLDSKGRAKDTRTKEQKIALEKLLIDLRKRYPSSKISGHRDFSKDLNGNGVIEPHEYMKECPCFNAIEEYKDL